MRRRGLHVQEDVEVGPHWNVRVGRGVGETMGGFDENYFTLNRRVESALSGHLCDVVSQACAGETSSSVRTVPHDANQGHWLGTSWLVQQAASRVDLKVRQSRCARDREVGR